MQTRKQVLFVLFQIMSETSFFFLTPAKWIRLPQYSSSDNLFRLFKSLKLHGFYLFLVTLGLCWLSSSMLACMCCVCTVCMCICMCMSVCACVIVYVCERERERERLKIKIWHCACSLIDNCHLSVVFKWWWTWMTSWVSVWMRKMCVTLAKVTLLSSCWTLEWLWESQSPTLSAAASKYMLSNNLIFISSSQ